MLLKNIDTLNHIGCIEMAISVKQWVRRKQKLRESSKEKKRNAERAVVNEGESNNQPHSIECHRKKKNQKREINKWDKQQIDQA